MLSISFLFYLGHNLNISDNPHAVSERDPCVWLFVYELRGPPLDFQGGEGQEYFWNK